MTEFEAFPKLYRLHGPVIISEKLDGSNGCIYIGEDGTFAVGSRTRWITPDKDNFGFAKWAYNNKEKLIEILGAGRHYGEYWGRGIQRGYSLSERRFSLFNTSRWSNTEELNAIGVYVVPKIYEGVFDTVSFSSALDLLKKLGSIAAPGFDRPEGIVIYDTRSGTGYKKTFDYDDTGKNTPRNIHGNVLV